MTAPAPQGDLVRVLVALDVPADQATDVEDLLASVTARVAQEAGYLDSGDPVMPHVVVATVVTRPDDVLLDADTLRGAYEVGIEGAADFNPRAEALRDGVCLGQYEDHSEGCDFAEGRSGTCTC